ncbi:FxDxF family PEP-CTERM protein [Massilia antarctica]|uniref:FxDxF family PEP-CTERM protein n=1 Tax=Massilia antarctica TaxID=2765360 RepID=A0AA48WJM0_9BURK|nr:FxDxF family PEP-CTERM protein [Massilia antarctica]QPI52345.1 FxDxF family PEP-CTERM protein [Massilia antarctica]
MTFGRSLLSALLLGIFATPAFAATPSYSVKVVNTGGEYDYWRLIDNAGTLYGQTMGHAAYHSGGVTHVLDLSSTSPSPDGSVTAISHAGHMATSEYWAPYMPRSPIDAYLTLNGATTHLEPLSTAGGLPVTWANGVNNDGTVVGYSQTDVRAPGGDPYDPRYATHAFAYSGGITKDLGSLGGMYSSAAAINNAGTIVGYSADASERNRAFIYQNGRMTDLGAFEGGTSVAKDINDAGLIIGQSAHGSDRQLLSAFVYSNGVMTDLGWSPQYTSSASDINNLGEVIGYGADAYGQQHGFIYQNGQLVQLDTAVDPLAGWNIKTTYSINDQGQILANACKLGVCGTVLLSPVPEPETYAMMLAGLGLLGFCARRRGRAA